MIYLVTQVIYLILESMSYQKRNLYSSRATDKFTYIRAGGTMGELSAPFLVASETSLLAKHLTIPVIVQSEKRSISCPFKTMQMFQ